MVTALTLQQRLERLLVRLDELTFWRDRAFQEIDGWTFDGAPWSLGEPWLRRDGVVAIAHPGMEVPEDWDLANTRLDLNLGGEGLVNVCYTNGGQEGFGLDPNHQRFPLRDRAFTVSASVVARFPFGVPNRDPRLERARLVLADPALERLIRRLILVIEAAGTLLDHEVAPHLIAAAEAALVELDWPSATQPYISRLEGSAKLQDIWQLPSGLDAHPPALDEAQQASVAAADSRLQRDLQRIQGLYPHQGRLGLTGQAHLDLAWLWPLDETRRKAQRTAHTVISLMDRYPDLTFHLTSAQVYTFLEEDDPALFAAIKQRVEEGRWETIGGMWVEPDLNLPSGESLTRQLLYGQRYFQRVFGKRHTVAWLPDCFGFTPALPQLLRGAGIDNFFTTKLNWSESNIFPFDLFWWEGMDGSRVLAHTFYNPGADNLDYARVVQEQEEGTGGYNGKPGPFSVRATWRNFRGKNLYPESLFSMGYGDGGGGPNAEMVERVHQMEDFPVLPTLHFTRVEEYYERLREETNLKEVPSWTGELYLELHRGTYTTQGRTKYLHRRAEQDLVAAETVGALAALAGAAEPSSLEEQWHLVLRNEFHDILPGSSIREVYERAEAELTSVVDAASCRTVEALDTLAEKLGGSGGQGVLVVNPDLSPRPLRIESSENLPGGQPVEGGSVLASNQQVPALGALVVGQAEAAGELSVTERSLENQYLRVTLAEDGTLTSVWDKRAGREVLDGRGNQLWAYVDKPREWDAWDIDAMYTEQGQEITDVTSIEVVERGPHRASIRILRPFHDSSIRQEIRLWANSPRLEFRTTLDWHDRRWLLKARFPLAIHTAYGTFETAFGVVQRPTHRNTPWDAARFEVVAHRFVDLSEPDYGVALLNDGKYGHDVRGNETGISLLRSPHYPDPLADEGEQTFTYALLPHEGTWLNGGVLMEAEDLNRPLLVRTGVNSEPRAWQPMQVSGLPVGLGAFKVLEDGGGLLLRVYEPQGSRGAVNVTLPEGWRLGAELNLLEESAGEPQLQLSPFQVRTWRIDRV